MPEVQKFLEQRLGFPKLVIVSIIEVLAILEHIWVCVADGLELDETVEVLVSRSELQNRGVGTHIGIAILGAFYQRDTSVVAPAHGIIGRTILKPSFTTIDTSTIFFRRLVSKAFQGCEIMRTYTKRRIPNIGGPKIEVLWSTVEHHRLCFVREEHRGRGKRHEKKQEKHCDFIEKYAIFVSVH